MPSARCIGFSGKENNIKMSLLQSASAKQLEVIMQELGERPGDVERGVRDLQAFCATSPNLPSPEKLDPHFLALFIRGCRMDTERARAKLESFFIARSRHKDLFEHRTLSENPLKEVCKFITIVPLPKLTDEGYRVTVFRIRPDYTEASADITSAVKAVLLVSDVRMHDERSITGDVFVWDISSVRCSIVGRVATAFSAVKRGIHLAHAAYPQRLKRNHIIGAPPFMASSLQLMRSCMNEKVKRRFYLHSKVEDLHQHIPAKVLPAEWGGQETNIDILSNKWRQRIDDLQYYLCELNDTKQVPAKNSNENDLFGSVGAFRKLDID